MARLKVLFATYVGCNFKAYFLFAEIVTDGFIGLCNYIAEYYPVNKKLGFKSVLPPESHGEKDVKSKQWWPKDGCDGRLIANILIMAIHANLCCPLHQIHSLNFCH